MIWTPYSGALGSIPILAGGNIWTFYAAFYDGEDNGEIFFNQMTPAGSVSSGESGIIEGPTGATNLVTDGTNVYFQYRDIYPRVYVCYCDISTMAVTTEGGGQFAPVGMVMVGAGSAIVTGAGYGLSLPEVTSFPSLPSTSGSAQNTFGSTDGDLGLAVFDGTNVWSAFNDGTNGWIYAIDPSTLAGTIYELPVQTSLGAQNGFDGRYVYIAATNGDGGGIVIWDTVDLTGTVVNTGTAYGNCWYSANQSKVFINDGDGNIYTMPPGGGSLTNVGNASTILGVGSGAGVNGFCDGPDGNDVWVNISSSGDNWNCVGIPGYPNTGQVLL
jgi:hypothetical protein